jgi:hypothetical protein
MKISDVLESLQRFPQDAKLIYDGGEIRVALFGYIKEDNNGQPCVPMYDLDAKSEDLPWLWNRHWLEEHEIEALQKAKQDTEEEMTQHDKVRRDCALKVKHATYANEQEELEALSDALRGLQSTDDPRFVPLHDELLERYLIILGKNENETWLSLSRRMFLAANDFG